MTVEINLNEELDKKLNKELSTQNTTLEDYINNLVEKDLIYKINLKKGFYLDTYSKKLFNKKDEVIKLTQIQYNIVELLAKNEKEIVSPEQLIKLCWDRKEVSIFTLRNMIKQIRDKTFYEIVKSHSNLGYSVNI